MALIYLCDVCKKQIMQPSERVSMQVHRADKDTKVSYHFHPECYSVYITPAICGNTYKDKMHKSYDSDSLELREGKEKPEEKAQVIEKKETVKKKEVTETKPKTDVNTPQVCRVSQYFTESSCYHIHRLILMGAQTKNLYRRFDVPYQSMMSYVKAFDKSCIDEYRPINPGTTLNMIMKKYCRRLPKVRALLATCTWTFKDVASECNMEQDEVEMFYNDFPWFLSRWMIIESLEGLGSDGNKGNKED